jgi:RNA polymerase sigma factor (sigma-70 family)
MPALAAPLDRSSLAPLPGGPMASDPALVRRCRRGEDRAFELIYARYHGPLYRYCRSLMGSHEDAEESLQTTMMKAYRALRTAEREVSLKPWLFRIAHNECMRALSGRRRHAELSGMEEALGEGSPERAEVRADLDQLRRDLAALPTEQRSALLLREMCGLSHREIGDSLGTAPEAVKQLIYEARQTLHEFGEGRALACDQVRARLSEGDGRVLRARRMRAHLRTCAGCTAFRERLTTRPVQLAALFPVLPAAAARWVLQAVLGGGAGAGGAGALVSAGLGGVGLKVAVAAALALVAGAATLPLAPSGARPSSSAAAVAGGAPSALLIPPARTVPAPAPSAPAPARVLDSLSDAGAPIAAVGSGAAVDAESHPNEAGSGEPAPADPQAGSAPAAPSTTGSTIAGSSATPDPTRDLDSAQPAPSLVGPTTGPPGPASSDAPTPPAPTLVVPTTSAPPAPPLPTVRVPALPALPSVTTPPVTTPPLTTPAVTVPQVPILPPVTVPEVTVPAVTQPPLTVPQVATPPITTPQLPAFPGLG